MLQSLNCTNKHCNSKNTICNLRRTCTNNWTQLSPAWLSWSSCFLELNLVFLQSKGCHVAIFFLSYMPFYSNCHANLRWDSLKIGNLAKYNFIILFPVMASISYHDQSFNDWQGQVKWQSSARDLPVLNGGSTSYLNLAL